MRFVATKVAELLLAPSTLLLAIALAGFALLLVRRRRAGLAALGLSLAAQCLVLALPLDTWALAPLEDRFAPCRTLPPNLAGVIALGGAVDTPVTEARGMPTLDSAAGRMTEFTRLARIAPPGVVFAFTGGSGLVFGGHLSEAEVARAFFDEQGVSRPVVYEGRSRTTWENAVNLRALLHPAPGQTWLLDTSADHMPRAVEAFRAAGFDVVADPVAYQTAYTLAAESESGFADRLGRLDEAAHEWQGLLAYRLMGRSQTLWPPAPAACGVVRAG